MYVCIRTNNNNQSGATCERFARFISTRLAGMEVGGDKTNKTTFRFLQRWLPVFLVGLFDTYGRSDSLTDNVALCGELRQLGITSLDQLDVLCVVLCRKIQRVTGCGCCIALLLPQISVHMVWSCKLQLQT